MRSRAGIDCILTVLLNDLLSNVDGIPALRIERDDDLDVDILAFCRVVGRGAAKEV